MNIIKRLFFLLLLFSLPVKAIERDTVLSTTVHFVVGSDEVIPNDSGYFNYKNSILPFLYSNIEFLDSISLKSTTSPEGSKKINMKLSHMRVNTITDYLYVDKEKIYIDYIGEDYDGFYKLYPNENIKKAIETKGNVKKEILSLPNYENLKREIFPLLRSVSFNAYFSPKETIPPMIICETDTVFITSLDTVFIKKELNRFPIVAVKTNVLADLVPYSQFGISFMPNVQLEVYTYLWNLSFEFEFTCPWWSNDKTHKYFQVADGTLGVRRYMNSDYSGLYLGLYGNTVKYDLLGDKNKGYQGEGYGLGVTYGYVFKNRKHDHLKIEPYARVGFFFSNFDEYHTPEDFQGKYYYSYTGKISEFKERDGKLNYCGLTMLGINITYDLIWGKSYR